ncbi:carbon-nitrogen hydrolase family protein [Haloarcula nitratireducens]|uniref:Carbon-nitrogen hydrolase family protein n=1 Tax=Haloarcula nitratireducens TaxID=2487749 RepID=A0AAW4PG11_9EURY|nr:carbon-nitrogen hydrolase family protein [Halomicroarcula nitratireducens]MBX0296240.1 carbon-nitrogen hydrolase family protein [Halomicroarcula nitratireducens]
MDRATVSVVQFESSLGPADDGTRERMADAITAADADLVVFPELATTGYHVFEDLPDVAESVPGPTTERLGEAAAAADTAVLFGMPVREDSRVYNSAVWLDADGEVRTRYDKRHCWGGERDCFATGDEYAVVEAPFGRVGVQICYDLNFPAASAALARAGCDVLVNISAWTARMERDWHTLLPARALEQGAYVVGCNQAGTEAGRTFCGRSGVYEPDGTRIAALGDSPGQLSVPLEPAVAAAERRRNPMREDRPATDADASER